MALPPTSETRQYLQFLESKPAVDFALDFTTTGRVPALRTGIAGRTWDTFLLNASSSRNQKQLNIVVQIKDVGEESSRNRLQIVIFHNDDARPLSRVTGALFKALLIKGVNYLAETRTRMVQLNSEFEGVNQLWDGEKLMPF